MEDGNIHIITKGYWPLPRFVKMWDGEWNELTEKHRAENGKSVACSIDGHMKDSKLIIIEAEITKALPKKIIATIGGSRPRRFVLSRWMGGIYSNANGRNLGQLRAFYDAIAPIYRYHVEPEREGQLAALVPFIPAGSRVLDASAGDCTFAKSAEERRMGLEIWCNDISEKMLGLRGAGIADSRISIGSASGLKFPARSFDAVVHTFSNIHSLDKRFFRSFNRVLRPGGLLLYHPVKAPGEQWPKDFPARVEKELVNAGFERVERKSVESLGKRKKTTLVFYRGYKTA